MGRAGKRTNRRPGRRRRSHERAYFDYALLFIIVFLVIFGIVMLYSVSYYTAQTSFDDPLYYVKRQGFAITLGFAAMLFTAIIDYHLYGKLIWLIYIGALGANALLWSPLGRNYSGSTRWLRIGPVSFQPSELTKIAVILFVAYVISQSPKKIQQLKGLMGLMVLVALLDAPVIISNLSTAIIIFGIGFGMAFIACKERKYFIGVIGAGCIAVAGALIFFPYRLERVQIWFHPENYDKGYQTLQGLYAIGSGGLFGKGLGQSVQKLTAVPEPENDMIFTIICEELGLVGAIAIILLFVMLIWRLLFIANNAKDLFGSMIAIGIMIHIALQVTLNIAVVTNTLPNTGITLPFISYGGTSVAILLAEMGIALNISRSIRLDSLEVNTNEHN